jgi:endonuclease/exonuclease/phosphatase (EEP) superfamily protein YafD
MPYASRTGGLGVGVLALTASLALILLPEAAPAAGPQPEQQCAQSPLFEIETGQAALAGELEVLSWNIQKTSNAGWADDLATLGDSVDLAFIQEASAQAGLSQFIPRTLHQAFARGYTTEAMETGVMTLAAGLPSMHCNLTTMEPWLGTPKATSVASYPLQDRDDRLLTINLHAVNFALGLEEFREQFAALKNLLSDHQGPIILAGDLNTWSGKRQSLVDNFMAEHDLQAVSFEPDLRTTMFGRALDHIYVRGMHALSAEVIPVSTSDHNPLRVRLGLQ